MNKEATLTPDELARAVQILRSGHLVAIPTETVYGLGADASNPQAVTRIFDAKGRPKRHPVIVHVADSDPIDQSLIGWAADIPDSARSLAAAFWPGPLTMILKRGPKAHDGITGGKPTIGLRVPSHPIALAIVRAFGDGIAAPSANRFGHVSPTAAEHVREELGDRVQLILDGGPCQVGVESTIIDLSGSTPRLLRPGMITSEAVESVLGVTLDTTIVTQSVSTSEAPGTLASHYAPKAPVHVVAIDALNKEVKTAEQTKNWPAVLSFQERPVGWPEARWLRAPSEPKDCARHLYASLRALDESEPHHILVEAVPDNGLWTAIADRLRRAAAPR